MRQLVCAALAAVLVAFTPTSQAAQSKIRSTEKQVGTAVVTDVQERFAIVTVTGSAATADIIRK